MYNFKERNSKNKITYKNVLESGEKIENVVPIIENKVKLISPPKLTNYANKETYDWSQVKNITYFEESSYF